MRSAFSRARTWPGPRGAATTTHSCAAEPAASPPDGTQPIADAVTERSGARLCHMRPPSTTARSSSAPAACKRVGNKQGGSRWLASVWAHSSARLAKTRPPSTTRR
eukprot:163546-Chlamydomonas_euryale.AAC.1